MIILKYLENKNWGTEWRILLDFNKTHMINKNLFLTYSQRQWPSAQPLIVNNTKELDWLLKSSLDWKVNLGAKIMSLTIKKIYGSIYTLQVQDHQNMII